MMYQEFLASKALRAKMRGLDVIPDLAPHLFPFQRMAVDFCLRVGSGALFLDTGTGKTEIQLEWCHQVTSAVGGRSLILTPLAVAGQTARRAARWGYEARVIRDQSGAGPGINICNYDRLDKLDTKAFTAVSLDEASLLKSFSGKTRAALTDAFRGHRFKLVATATPAPNDHMEIGTYADFLEVMSVSEMLSRFFINDTSTASHQWRLKGHAKSAFYDWMASWARMAEKPSDLTGNTEDDARFVLPELKVVRHRAHNSIISNELYDLFGTPSVSATGIHGLKRQTSTARAEKLAEVVRAEPDRNWLIWVDTNDEADAVLRVLPGTAEVRGSQSSDVKEEKLEAFSTGQIKDLVSKPSLSGFGMDWSHCDRMAFIGRSYSYETWYQAVRRCWRFGQQKPVIVHLIVAEGEDEIGRVIDRKASDHIGMKSAMREAMRRNSATEADRMVVYNPKVIGRLPAWLAA